MLRYLVLLLLLIPVPLSVQNKAYPTPGKAVGLVVSEVSGEWGVLSQDFITSIDPVPLNEGKVCWFEAPPGNYAVIQSGTADGRLRITVVTLGKPAPLPPIPPGPGPSPEPQPNPPQPAPIPGAGFKVLFLYETEGGLTEKQLQALNSTMLVSYLNSKCQKDANGVPLWKSWDDDYTETGLKDVSPDLRTAYLTAQKAKKDNVPWVVVSNGVSGESVQLPPTLPDVMTLLKHYGGN